MNHVYVNKEYWPPRSSLPCLHCGNRIMHRPIPIGVSETGVTNGISTCGHFCSWPCARAYASANCSDDAIEALTTRIMLDFRASVDANDDQASWRFLQAYSRFSQIPSAPPRDSFVPYGPLTHEQFRASWAGAPPTATDTFGGMITSGKTVDRRTVEETVCKGLQSSSEPGAIIDTDSAQAYAFQRAPTGFSTKRQYRPRVRLSQTYWPGLGLWADDSATRGDDRPADPPDGAPSTSWR